MSRAYFCLVSAQSKRVKKVLARLDSRILPVISVFRKRRKQEDDLGFYDGEQRTVVALVGKVGHGLCRTQPTQGNELCTPQRDKIKCTKPRRRLCVARRRGARNAGYARASQQTIFVDGNSQPGDGSHGRNSVLELIRWIIHPQRHLQLRACAYWTNEYMYLTLAAAWRPGGSKNSLGSIIKDIIPNPPLAPSDKLTPNPEAHRRHCTLRRIWKSRA